MPLTREQANLAGQLDAAITAADQAIADLDARIVQVQENNFTAIGSSMMLSDNTTLRADMPLSTEEVISILELYKGVLESKKNAAQTALDAIEIAAVEPPQE